MSKEELNKILILNLYLTICKKNSPNCKNTELIRKLLTARLKKFLNLSIN